MNPARFQYMACARQLAFGLGLAGFAGLLLAGLYRNLVLEQRAPPLSNQYGAYVNQLAASEDWEAVLRALRLAASLDLIETRVESEIIPNLVRLARREGDRESELVAWRSLAQRRPDDPVAHLQLAWLLLSTSSPVDAAREEAELHARWALGLEPVSVPARVSLGRVALLEGDVEVGVALWQEATALDPELTQRLLRSLAPLAPEAVEAFHLRQREAGEG
jgi:hypothetical protein